MQLTGKRTYSLYLDDAEVVAVNRVAKASNMTVNAVCRALIRRGLGLPAAELTVPAVVTAWAERRAAAAQADEDLDS